VCVCVFMSFQQVLIIAKYIFQFNFYPWNKENHELDIMDPVYIFGIEKKNDYAAFDLFLLFSLFIHRSILKVSKFLYYRICYDSVTLLHTQDTHHTLFLGPFSR